MKKQYQDAETEKNEKGGNCPMKEKYQVPEMEIIRMDDEDVIVTSSDDWGGGDLPGSVLHDNSAE